MCCLQIKDVRAFFLKFPDRAISALREYPQVYSAIRELAADVVDATNRSSDEDDPDAIEAVTVPPFCKCGRCSPRSIGIEKQCCRIKRGPCVCDGAELQAVVLNEAVVRAAINADHMRLCEEEWQHGHNNFRHQAYKQFV